MSEETKVAELRDALWKAREERDEARWAIGARPNQDLVAAAHDLSKRIFRAKEALARCDSARIEFARKLRSALDERDSLRAQLVALAAEHESAALDAESRMQALSLVSRAAIACADERFQAELREALAEAMEVQA